MSVELKIIYSVGLVVLLILIRLVIERIIVMRIMKASFSKDRRKMISKLVNVGLFFLMGLGLTSIWGMEGSQIALFLTSTMTILGVAFFAQWSHLSNVTAGIMIFFNSSIRVGDTISILDKDFEIKGIIDDVRGLYVRLRTEEGAIISIPNNILLQKPIIISQKDDGTE